MGEAQKKSADAPPEFLSLIGICRWRADKETRLATRSQLQAVLTQEVIRRGIIYAKLLLNKRSWRVKPEPEDAVSACVTKLFGDPGAWNPNRGSISTYLHLMIRSEVDHLATSADNMLCAALDDEGDDGARSHLERSVPPQQETVTELAEAMRRLAAMRSENVIEFGAKRGSHGKSDQLRLVADAMFHGITEPTDIAAACNLPVRQVYELKGQITRKLQAWGNAPSNKQQHTTDALVRKGADDEEQ